MDPGKCERGEAEQTHEGGLARAGKECTCGSVHVKAEAKSNNGFALRSRSPVHARTVFVFLQKIGAFLIRESFEQEFLLPSNVDIHRVTWCLEAQSDRPIVKSHVSFPQEDSTDSESALIGRAPPQRKQSLSDHNQLIVHAPFANPSTRSKLPRRNKSSSQPEIRLLEMDENEYGTVSVSQVQSPTNQNWDGDQVRSIPVTTMGVSRKQSEKFSLPLKMSEQPAEYNLTDTGCELTETLDPDVDPTSIRVHVKKSRGQIWLTFAREIIQEQVAYEMSETPDPQLFKVRTTSRREFKLNPEKFNLRGTTARVTSGKIIINVPYL
ncbi:hypothetical protein Ciccas_006266 [Cichlidogyrus casuarinus]|uniref:Uncharacterized protein n=1 Tax=Cichlidogyrus casuarinus TaxID=1844966 RepID=A0ABD2Q6A2_9PLAT